MPAHGRRAVARGTRARRHDIVAFAATCGLAFSAAGYFMHPFGPEPMYQSVSRYLATHTRPDDRVLVWGSVPEIYWASNRRPATRFLTTPTFLADDNPGRPAEEVDPRRRPGQWEYFYEDLAAHPPRYVLDTSPARSAARSTPDRRVPPAQKILDDQYRYVRSIDEHRHLRRR